MLTLFRALISYLDYVHAIWSDTYLLRCRPTRNAGTSGPGGVSSSRSLMPGIQTYRPLELLIIEDNPGDVCLLEEAFGELRANVRISVAKDGAEGLDLLINDGNTWRPDLVLLDLNLPKVSGHDVLSQIKNNPLTRWIPVIVLSSSQAESDIRRAYESHANAYLRKPSTLEGLMAAALDVKRFWMETATLPG